MSNMLDERRTMKKKSKYRSLFLTGTKRDTHRPV